MPITVSEPPSSKTRGRPNSRFGTSSAGVDAAGHGPAAVGLLVVGPRQPRQAVEQDEDVRPISARRFARSTTSSAVRTWLAGRCRERER